MYNGQETFGAIVEHRAKSKPNEKFIRFENTSLTYETFHKTGNKVANFMSKLGLSKGDTCGVMLPIARNF